MLWCTESVWVVYFDTPRGDPSRNHRIKPPWSYVLLEKEKLSSTGALSSPTCLENSCPDQAAACERELAPARSQCVHSCGSERERCGGKGVGMGVPREYDYLIQKKKAFEGVGPFAAPAFCTPLVQREPGGSSICNISADILRNTRCLVSCFGHPVRVCKQKKKISLGLWRSI